MRRLFLAALLLLLDSADSRAEIHQCGGVWTSRPCGEAGTAPGTAEAPAQATQARLQRGKKDVVAKAELRLLKGRDEAKIEMNVTSIVRPLYSFCAKPEVSIDECRSAVDKEEKAASEKFTRAEQQIPKEGDSIEADEGVDIAVSGPGYNRTVKRKGKKGEVEMRPRATTEITTGTRVRIRN